MTDSNTKRPAPLLNDLKTLSGRHVAIDIESLDLRPTTVVVSIGAVIFDADGNIYDSFYAVLDRDMQHACGRTIGEATMKWWQEQDPAVRAVLDAPGDPVGKVLDSLRAFIPDDCQGVWGFGADFDNAAINSLADTFDVKRPWHYKLNRCGRTLVGLVGEFMPELPRNGTPHNALDDAWHQAKRFAVAADILNRGVAYRAGYRAAQLDGASFTA